MSAPAVTVAVEESTQVGAARRAAMTVARAAGLGSEPAARCALITTELATNLVRYAQDGEIVLQRIEGGVEVVALDRGPGIANLAECMRDGYTEGTTPGSGLGAVRRAADVFDAASRPSAGTAVFARVATNGARPTHRRAECAGLTVPLPGETVCGDSWAAASLEDRTAILLADGLGHGPAAAAAGRAATDRFAYGADPASAVRALHDALRGTRGAAVGVAVVDPARSVVRFAGAGNVAGTVVYRDGSAQRLASQNGTAGIAIGRILDVEAPWPAGATLVLHSDGLHSGWQPEQFPGLFTRHPALVAGVLYRDLARRTDDAGVAVLRNRGVA